MRSRAGRPAHRRAARVVLVAVIALVAGAAEPGAARPAAGEAPPNHVTMITDSVGGVLFWAEQARKELSRGLDFDLETKTCRKLVEPGCPAYGDPAPRSALDVVRSLGAALGPTVVIDVGYNDRAEGYGRALDQVMEALAAAGVRHVVWVTLEEAQEVWAEINGAIRAAPRRWPQMSVADWAVASAGKPWFSDGVHMTYEGGLEFARFLRPFVLAACGEPCTPPPPLLVVSRRLPVARRGRPYRAGAEAQGGVPPYRWFVRGLPHGLHLSRGGVISGVPRAAGVSLVLLGVRDAWDDEAVARLALRVRT